ncbi:MAG: ATP-dependent DNA helicase [Lachnospiraceae bacterium]|nr:ATP-dependent DNA helicase [Lachnospiraceae bacterium]
MSRTKKKTEQLPAPEAVEVRVSVRDFVEFLTRSGDIDNRSSGRDADAMSEGAKWHRKIQKAQPSGYRAEVAMQHTELIEFEGNTFAITIEGRADGVYEDDTYGPAIDEIKCMIRDVNTLEGPVPVHIAQARCYAYMMSLDRDLSQVTVRMTYVHLDAGTIRYFYETLQREELTEWFLSLCREYCRWAKWTHDHTEARNASLAELAFPFEYRPGQKELVTDVYRSILRRRKLFIEAPTGVGKTVSTMFPAVMAMGRGLVEKIFYLTAKTIARTVAEECTDTLISSGAALFTLTLTAKEKMCVLEEPNCNPEACPRAAGHFDRVGEALYALLSEAVADNSRHIGRSIRRETILEYSERYRVCPHELSLDLSLFADAVICDYNYVFDPTAYLRRYFSEGIRREYLFLIDEAHNLVERSRDMYSAEIVKEDVLAAKRALTEHHRTAAGHCDRLNRAMLAIRRECDGFTVLDGISDLVSKAEHLNSALSDVLADRHKPVPDEAVTLYLALQHFLAMYEQMENNYKTYADFRDNGDFFVRLQCMDASAPLSVCLDRARSSIFFSATLLPIAYYKEQLGGQSDDYAVYSPTPFDPAKRLVLVARDVNTRFKNRTATEYAKIAEYIKTMVSARSGNYIAFFPSYRFVADVAAEFEGWDGEVLVQTANMSEKTREEYLAAFAAEHEGPLLGLFVMGGIFSEGIDLRNDSLIGAIIVGPGLPMVCNERELFRDYYEQRSGQGFDYAYLYPGMNKVLQAAGRVIRTIDDTGCILLLDDRFGTPAYRNLFPREWTPIHTVTRATLASRLQEFWREHEGGTNSEVVGSETDGSEAPEHI